MVGSECRARRLGCCGVGMTRCCPKGLESFGWNGAEHSELMARVDPCVSVVTMEVQEEDVKIGSHFRSEIAPEWNPASWACFGIPAAPEEGAAIWASPD